MPVTIVIQNLQTRIPISPARIKTDIKMVCERLKLNQGLLSFVFVDDRRMRAINKKFLRHDYATDVLTFDLRERRNSRLLNGEIIISAQMAQRNAADFLVPVRKEIFLYAIHGLLHLLGYDDHNPAGIKKMRSKEQELLLLCETAGRNNRRGSQKIASLLASSQ